MFCPLESNWRFWTQSKMGNFIMYLWYVCLLDSSSHNGPIIVKFVERLVIHIRSGRLNQVNTWGPYARLRSTFRESAPCLSNSCKEGVQSKSNHQYWTVCNPVIFVQHTLLYTLELLRLSLLRVAVWIRRRRRCREQFTTQEQGPYQFTHPGTPIIRS